LKVRIISDCLLLSIAIFLWHSIESDPTHWTGFTFLTFIFLQDKIFKPLNLERGKDALLDFKNRSPRFFERHSLAK